MKHKNAETNEEICLHRKALDVARKYIIDQAENGATDVAKFEASKYILNNISDFCDFNDE